MTAVTTFRAPAVNFGDERLPERFWSKVMPSTAGDGCWLWTGDTNADGYGEIWITDADSPVTRGRRKRRSVRTHRHVFEALVCAIPPGLELDHWSCSQRCCCNPAHLEPVTHSENVSRIPMRLECKRGHRFSEGSFYINLAGARVCKVCDSIRHARKYRDDPSYREKIRSRRHTQSPDSSKP